MFDLTERLHSILIVDDQPELLDSLRLALEAVGYHVLTATDGIEALEILRAQAVDMILADIAMPRLNGYQLYERVRQNPDWVLIPFIFLTARTLDSDIRYGKELGVDDYLVKPIQPEDLLAAVSGKLRRAQQLARLALPTPGALSRSERLAVGQLQIDPAQHRVALKGQPIQLSSREFTLLEHLARYPDQVVSPQDLIQATHGLSTDAIEAGALLRPLVRSVRRKLGYAAGEMGCIRNVRGVGYQLIAPDDE
jgi:DNA-binding response OmpR family regulator